jgi:hypothetical protein
LVIFQVGSHIFAPGWPPNSFHLKPPEQLGSQSVPPPHQACLLRQGLTNLTNSLSRIASNLDSLPRSWDYKRESLQLGHSIIHYFYQEKSQDFSD